jgi:TonB family protein
MKTFIAILVLALALPAFADQRLKDTLKKEYEKRILVLRTPLQKGDQEFDSDGKPLKDPPANQWRVYGPLLITWIKAESNALRLEGVRVPSTKDVNPVKEMLLQSGKRIKVDIHLDHPLNSSSEAQDIIGRVFFLDPKSAPYSQPEYRRPDENISGDQTVHKVDQKRVFAPKPIFMPDPAYSVQAREAKYQGTLTLDVVIDSQGRVSRIKLARPLGLGLDDMAMEKVQTWKFNPAMLDGKPVAVEVNIEVSFNLY